MSALARIASSAKQARSTGKRDIVLVVAGLFVGCSLYFTFAAAVRAVTG